MLINKKLQKTKFSASEQVIVDYILEKKSYIKNKTTKEISSETFTSPSTLIRIAKKLGYNGWNELKEDYLQELEYLDSHFSGIDANIPFTRRDTFMSISNKMAVLSKETIEDTLALLNQEELAKAVDLMKQASSVNLFATSYNQVNSQDFHLKMLRINKKVDVCMTEGEFMFTAFSCDKNSCAIVISYSGETTSLIKTVETLRKRGIPIIAITSIGENSISKHADCVLRISSREKLYSKIANFTSTTSIRYILDVLYSCYFSLAYDDNLRYKIETSRHLESNRYSPVDIINENT